MNNNTNMFLVQCFRNCQSTFPHRPFIIIIIIIIIIMIITIITIITTSIIVIVCMYVYIYIYNHMLNTLSPGRAASSSCGRSGASGIRSTPGTDRCTGSISYKLLLFIINSYYLRLVNMTYD